MVRFSFWKELMMHKYQILRCLLNSRLKVNLNYLRITNEKCSVVGLY